MASQVQGQEQGYDWIFIEIWVETGLRTPPILELICRRSDLYEIVDPRKNYQVIFSTPDYMEAAYWLAEDEYQRVTGKLVNPLLDQPDEDDEV